MSKPGSIVQPEEVVRGFPRAPQGEVERPHIIESIASMYERGTRAVTIECDAQVGATTILSQFVRQKWPRALGLFIDTCSARGFDVNFLRLTLYEQIKYFVEGKLPQVDTVSDADYTLAVIKLQRHIRGKQPFWIVVDGLFQIPQESSAAARAILGDVVPLYVREIDFLFSGDVDRLRDMLPSPIIPRAFVLPYFTFAEARILLSPELSDEKDVASAYRVSRGIPGKLASIKRALADGRHIDEVLGGRLEDLADFIHGECREVAALPDELKLAISVVVTARHPLQIDDIGVICGIDSGNLKSSISKLPYIELDSTGNITFATSAHRKYLSESLSGFAHKASELLLGHAVRAAQLSEGQIAAIPQYFSGLGKHREYIDFVDQGRLIEVAENCSSLALLRNLVDAAVNSARAVDSKIDSFRLSALMSVMRSVDSVVPFYEELDAHLKLGRLDDAVALASLPALREHRIKLLALYCKGVRELGRAIDPAILERLKTLLESADWTGREELCIDIASHLLNVDLELAFQLIEKVAGEAGEAADSAYVALAIAGHDGAMDEALRESIDGRVLSRIVDPEARGFARMVGLLVAGSGADQVLERASDLDQRHALFLMTSWLRVNQTNDVAYKVIEKCLEQILADPESTPTLSDFRLLALPLRHIRDCEKRVDLIRRIDGQKNLARGKSASEDYVRLELLLVEAQREVDPDAAENRVFDLYFHVNAIQDLATRCDCLAWIVARATVVDPTGSIDSRIGLISEARRDFESALDLVLGGTAEHDILVDASIRAFASTDAERAVRIALSLNTQSRRDSAMRKVIRLSLRSGECGGVLRKLSGWLVKIHDAKLRSFAVEDAVETLKDNQSSRDLNGDELDVVLNLVRQGFDAWRMLLIAVGIMELPLWRTGDRREARDRIDSEFSQCIEKIDGEWAKHELCCRAAAALAQYDKGAGERYLERANEIKRHMAVPSRNAAEIFSCCADVAGRAIGGLLRSGLEGEVDLRRIANVFRSTGTISTECLLWSELAIRAEVAGRSDLCKRIVREFVVPALESLKRLDVGRWAQVFLDVAPCIYIAHPASFDALCLEVDGRSRELAIANTISMVFERLPPREPFDIAGKRIYSVDYPRALDLLTLAERLARDANFFRVVALLCDSLKRTKKHRLANDQLRLISDRVITHARRVLPDSLGIRHDGYLILAEAKALSIISSTDAQWDALFGRARELSNASDSAFCMAVVLACQQERSEARVGKIENIRARVLDIPSDVDRCERYEAIAETLEEVDVATAKAFLRQGLDQAFILSDAPSAVERQRRMIDAMHRIDEAYAKDFAKRLEDDPAKVEARERIKERLTHLEISRRMDKFDIQEYANKRTRGQIPKAAWRRLGRLNAGTGIPVDSDSLVAAASCGGGFPIQDAVPIFSLGVQSCIMRFSGAKDVDRVLRPLSEAFLQVAELAHCLVRRASALATRGPVEGGSYDQYLFGGGDFERGRERIREWLREGRLEELFVCDPYFYPSEMWLIRLIREEQPRSTVRVLTSRRVANSVKGSLDDAYLDAWREVAGQDRLPEMEIVFCGTGEGGQLPVHDRWVLGADRGLRLGTSLGGLSASRLSEVSEMRPEEVRGTLEDLRPLFDRKRRTHAGGELKYLAMNF